MAAALLGSLRPPGPGPVPHGTGWAALPAARTGVLSVPTSPCSAHLASRQCWARGGAGFGGCLGGEPQCLAMAEGPVGHGRVAPPSSALPVLPLWGRGAHAVGRVSGLPLPLCSCPAEPGLHECRGSGPVCAMGEGPCAGGAACALCAVRGRQIILGFKKRVWGVCCRLLCCSCPCYLWHSSQTQL